MDDLEVSHIKQRVEEFLQKMTMVDFVVNVTMAHLPEIEEKKAVEIIEINIQLLEPQFLIGQNGQTLIEFQRLLKIMLNKGLKEPVHISLDINDYRKKKVEYLKQLARDIASEVVASKTRKILSPMSSFERMVIHKELSQRSDIATESQGMGIDRHIVVNPLN